MKKIKVVWICHFSNENVLKWINPWFKRNEIAQWIPNLIKGIQDNESIELHVISLHSGIGLYKKHIENNVTYHFVNYGIPIIGVPWPKFLPVDILTNYYLTNKIIKRIVKKINPNIITLFGAENPNYSYSWLGPNGFVASTKNIINLTYKMFGGETTAEALYQYDVLH